MQKNYQGMKDTDIRKVLLHQLHNSYIDDTDTIIVEELGLCQGEARIDVAVINGSIHGYEIKSELDTLKRLPAQREIYNKTLDTITLIAGTNHVEHAINEIPKWWGVAEAIYIRNKIHINKIRRPKHNNNADPYSIVQLLWRDEALDALRTRGLHRGFVSKPREVLWNRLVEHLDFNELRHEVRCRIKSRCNWRSV